MPGISSQQIQELIRSYDPERISIGVLGSHSALEVGYGAKQEGFPTVVVCQKGRELTYARYYRNLFDRLILLDRFSEILDESVQSKLRELNTIFVPNRAFSVYVGYDGIEQQFRVPIMGNRFLLRAEERTAPRNQYYLLERAKINHPKLLDSYDQIRALTIAKIQESRRPLERAFFYASSPQQFLRGFSRRVEAGILDQSQLNEVVLEEYILGAKFNANLFWSPLRKELDLLGFDRRIQTDLDGFLDLPAQDQLELAQLGAIPQNIEIGHQCVTLRESQLEKIFQAGESLVETCAKEYPPGIIGLFALQGAFDKQLEFWVYDLSFRVPGCPCVEPGSPYMRYKYGKEVGPGRRVAMEIRDAIQRDELELIVT